jgi:hypothetical protein
MMFPYKNSENFLISPNRLLRLVARYVFTVNNVQSVSCETTTALLRIRIVFQVTETKKTVGVEGSTRCG